MEVTLLLKLLEKLLFITIGGARILPVIGKSMTRQRLARERMEDKMKELMLFTGTRANPESIKKNGLLAGGLDRGDIDPLTQKYIINKEKTLARVLSEFGLVKKDIPDYIYRGELEYEANRPTHIHLCLDFNNAAGYSWMGGEPAYCIRRNLLEWLALRELGGELDLSKLGRARLNEIDYQAAMANGPKQYVVVVKIRMDDPRLEQDTKDLIARFEKLVEERGFVMRDLLKHSTWEVRYFGDIAPENILGMVQISARDFADLAKI